MLTDEHERDLAVRRQVRDVARAPVVVALLIEQLGRSPLVEQLRRQGRDDPLAQAAGARRRLVAIALDGLRPGSPAALPGAAPSSGLFAERWRSGPGDVTHRASGDA